MEPFDPKVKCHIKSTTKGMTLDRRRETDSLILGILPNSFSRFLAIGHPSTRYLLSSGHLVNAQHRYPLIGIIHHGVKEHRRAHFTMDETNSDTNLVVDCRQADASMHPSKMCRVSPWDAGDAQRTCLT
jgi:hypothetical protein